MLNRLSKKEILLLIAAILSFVVLAAFSGIVGNRADAFFMQVLPFLSKVVNFTLPLWVIVPVLLILLFLVVLNYYASQQAVKLLKLDESLLRLLAAFHDNPDQQSATKLLFQDFLANILELLPNGCRIFIMRQGEHDPDFLTIWQSWKIPSETIDRTRLQISNSQSRDIGLAGSVFLSGRQEVANFIWKNETWVEDNAKYVYIVPKNTRKSLPYKSTIAVPVINEITNTCIGVLCVDCSEPKTFDSQDVQRLLAVIAIRTSSILSILRC
jgi:hypothetical protein